MGGAACWQFAVHEADRWFAANPGAGFAETPQFLKVFQDEKVQPTWYERALWHLYDCTDYAANLRQADVHRAQRIPMTGLLFAQRSCRAKCRDAPAAERVLM